MNSKEIIKEYQRIAKENGYELSQSQVKDLIKVFEDTIVSAFEQLEESESCNLGIIKITKKKQAARKGVSKLQDGKETAWETPEMIKIALSAKKSFEKEHTIEV